MTFPPESQNIEYKESWRDEYLKWLCGFANAQGGELYLGIKDDGTVCGAKNPGMLMETLPNLIRDTLGIVADIDLLRKNELDYIRIAVAPNPYPVNYKGKYHYRSGSTKQELTGNALTSFLLKKSGLSWDAVTLNNADIASFRNDAFDIFREQAKLSARMSDKDAGVSNARLAQRLDLIDDGKLTRAGVLLFNHNPEKWVSGAWIKIGYFANDADILYQDEIHGSLLQQAEKVIDLLYTKYLIAPISYEGITRIETYPYPRGAVREAILNAIVHKNYGSFTPIQIRVYADRLRIANDSVLPEGVTPDQLINEGKSRPFNPKIANTFYRAGFIESWGRGIQEIREICGEYGNPQPNFKVDSDAVFVTFYPLKGAKYSADKAGRSDDSQVTERLPNKYRTTTEQVDRLLKCLGNDELSAREILEKLGLRHRPTLISYYLQPALKMRLIEMTQPDSPNSPTQKYRKADRKEQK